jgi:hypothetical protein
MDNSKNERIATNDLDDFQAAWRTAFEQGEPLVTVVEALIGLTNLGEHPVESTRLARALGRPVGEAEALALLRLHRGGPRMANRSFRWPCVHRQGGMGPELL